MTLQSKAYDTIISFMVTNPEAILAFKAPEALNKRVLELTNKEKEDSITEIEQKELDQYMWLEHLMRLAKARAKKELDDGALHS